MLDTFVLFVAGLAALIFGSSEAVMRGMRLARLTGISELAVGFILIAVGTSVPELAVSLFASAAGETQIAMGTLAGANIYDMTLVLGVTALFDTIILGRKDKSVVQTTALALVIAAFALLTPTLGLAFGLFCIALSGFFVWNAYKQGYVIGNHVHGRLRFPEALKSGVMLIVAIALVLLGANWTVGSAVAIATAAGLPEILISGLVIAAGTTLPELSVSVQAIRRRKPGLAIGNIAGSVVANFGLVLGLAAIARPIPVMRLDVLWLAGVLAAGAIFLWLSGRRKIGRREGIGLIALWLALMGVFIAARM